MASVLVAGSELLILHNTLQAMETNGQHTNEPGQHTNEHGQHTNEHGQHTNEPGQHTNEHGQHDDNGVHNKEGEEDGMEENKRTREQRAHHDTRPPPPHDAHDTPPHDAHNTPSASSSSSGEVVPAVGVVAVGGMRKRGSRVTLTSRLPARQPPVIPVCVWWVGYIVGGVLCVMSMCVSWMLCVGCTPCIRCVHNKVVDCIPTYHAYRCTHNSMLTLLYLFSLWLSHHTHTYTYTHKHT